MAGAIECNRGNYDIALSNFRNAYERNKKIKNEMGIARILYAMAWAYRLKEESNLEKAFIYNQKSLQISERIGDLLGVERVLTQLGCISYAKRDCSRALEYFRRAISMAIKVGNKREMALAIYEMANCFMILCNYKDAMENFEKALKIWDNLGISDEKIFAIWGLGGVCQAMGNYSSALGFYKRTLRIFIDIRFPYGLAFVLIDVGSLFKEIGEFSIAQRYIEKALKIATTSDLKLSEVRCYIHLSSLYIIKGNYAIAYGYYKKGIEIVKKTYMRQEYNQLFLLLSEIYYHEKKYLKGVKIANKVIKTTIDLGPKDFYAEALLLKAKNEIEQGILSRLENLQILDEAKKVAEEIGNPEVLWKVYFKYGRFLQDNKQYTKALEYYQKCNGIFKDIGSEIKKESYRMSYLNRPDRRVVFYAINEIEKIMS